ncbi:MAG: NAD-dependent DNA ligase LigA, partial [Clostridia bacterium]|nr:NAD-dependent DNA ligase LigA [Clostridia bacterium]
IPNVGKKTAKDLATRFGSVSALSAASEEELLAVEEIGEIIARDIAAFFASETGKTLVENLLKAGVTPQSKKRENAGGAFAGEIVVLTGTLEGYTRSQAAKLIEDAGGEIGSSVTSKTTLVIAGEAAGSKLDKARKLGVKIIDEKTLKSMLNS